MRIKGFLLGILAVFFSCKQAPAPMPTMKDDVVFLASDELKGRETGTEGATKAAEYIADRFEALGLEPLGTDNTYFQEFSFVPKTDPHGEVKFGVDGNGSITGINVLGFLNNDAPLTVIVGGHYDHLGMGGDGSLHRGEAAIHNGADDNASGIAVMLKLAELLPEKTQKHNYLFLAFTGEEMGLLGSNYFTKNPTLALDAVTCMFNLDMVGRLREDKTLSISGTGTSPVWNQVLNSTNPGFKLVLKESGVGPSDHTSFYFQDIPVLHFFTGQHEDYHKPSDDAHKLNYEGMQMLVDYMADAILELKMSEPMAFRKTKNESEEVPRFKVALGVIPDYLFDGKGMRIDGVSEDKPAQKAGLLKGDVVIQLGDSVVTDMMSYMRALSAFEKGDETEVTVDREGVQIKATITF